MPQSRSNPARNLTPADIEDIRAALASSHTCKLSPEELQLIHDFVTMWKEARSMVLKGLLTLIFFVIIAVIALSTSHRLKLPIIG